ncbi:MAG: host-nuclease inhibitor Gam family protein [Bacteroidales bacterium]|nr:host-nuclease inhibitor Gam family protein [Bacteroidales bacterium]
MTKTREKKTVYSGVQQEQFETAFADYARADARQQKINATMDVEMTRIREKYQEELGKLQETKDNSFDVMQAYAMEQKDVLFTKKKSLDCVHGTIGFRTGTPKLKTLKGFTWGAVTNLLTEFLPSYVRVVTEPAKDKLLADREDETVVMNLHKVGLYVVQDETFFVEPKKEE